MNKLLRRIGYMVAWVWAGLPLLLLCGLTSGLIGSMAGLYLVYSKDLPSIPDLRAYRPKTVSTFFAEDGSVIGLFYKEKRFPIDIGTLPDHVIQAFLAAEDSRFFSHSGLDFQGIIRALVQNIKDGTFSQGGSTITQQVTRNLLLSKEKKISRKVRELILSHRIEKTLSKREILGLYLNEIYLGKSAYGIESAAGTYFGKKAKDLNVAESAFIAGLAANPSKFSQQKNLEAALRRKDVILWRMAKAGFITDDEYHQATRLPLHFREDLPYPFEKVPYFTEAVRQYIVARYGEERLYNDGLQVWTTCDTELQQAATEALLNGARAWERRQGRPRGLVKRMDAGEVRAFLSGPGRGSFSVGEVVAAVVLDNPATKQTRQKKSHPNFQECLVGIPGNHRQWIRLPGGVPYRIHDLIRLRIIGLTDHAPEMELYDVPAVQGAVVCIENRTGFVRSLVGGLDFETSSFNRAVQALRQPGSAFKPIVFAAGLQWAGLTPHTLVIDEPIAVITSPSEPPWIPSNSDRSFLGVIPLSQALAYSRNIAAVKVFMETGADLIIQTARSMGISSRLRANPSLSLGASEVTLLELTGAYTAFPNNGIRLDPVLVKRVVDRFGRVLEDNTKVVVDPNQDAQKDATALDQSMPPDGNIGNKAQEESTTGSRSGLINELRSLADSRELDALDIETILERSFPRHRIPRQPVRVLNAETAYFMTKMLKETCISGTASMVAKLRRSDLAGKTGTTDDCSDAWFVGFNPTYTTGVWMGHDAKVSLGKKEYGATAALPVWMDFTRKLLQKDPIKDYPRPQQSTITAEARMEQGFEAWNSSDADENPTGYGYPKTVLSVDAAQLQSWWTMNPAMYNQASSFSGYATYATGFASHYGNSIYGQTLRLLSPYGEELGTGVLAQDEKGRVNIIPLMENSTHYNPQASEAWRSNNQPYSARQAPYWEGSIPYNSLLPYQGIVR